MSKVELPLDSIEIQKILPHRYPIILVDRVIEFEPQKKIVGIKNVTANEPFFQGHFPGKPIMPGVLILEALAQLGGIFAKLCSEDMRKGLVVFVGADEVRFRKQVIPGDTLRLEMSFEGQKLVYWKMKGSATVDGQKVAEGMLTAAIVND